MPVLEHCTVSLLVPAGGVQLGVQRVSSDPGTRASGRRGLSLGGYRLTKFISGSPVGKSANLFRTGRIGCFHVSH